MLVDLSSSKLLWAISKEKSWEVGTKAKVNFTILLSLGGWNKLFLLELDFRELNYTLSLPRFYYFNLQVLTINP